MASDIELGVATMFRDAVKQNITLDLRTQGDWDRFKAIDEEARKRTRHAVDSFEENRPALLATARKEIIDKAGAKTFEHPTPFGTDRFSKSEIDRQAVTKVFNDHQAQLLSIKSDESEAYQSLRYDILKREGVRDVARDAFSRATDRRNGEDRRMPSRER